MPIPNENLKSIILKLREVQYAQKAGYNIAHIKLEASIGDLCSLAGLEKDWGFNMERMEKAEMI